MYDAAYILALLAVLSVILGCVVLACTIWAWRLPLPGHCPRCGYDMSHADSRRCPECGRTPGRLRRALVGRHSWRWLVLGAVMIAAGGSVLYVNRTGWRDLLPTQALLAIAPFVESACDAPGWRREVMRELAQRIRDGNLSDGQTSRFLDLAARALEDGRATAQDEYYVSLVAIIAQRGTLWQLGRAEEFLGWTTYDFFWLSAPTRWPLDRPLPLSIGGRHDWGQHWVPLEATVRFGDGPTVAAVHDDPEGIWSTVAIPPDLDAGIHDLRVEGRILIPRSTIPPHDRVPFGDPIARTVRVEFLPFDEIFVRIDDVQADAAVRNGLAWEWDGANQQVRLHFPPASRPYLTQAILRLDVMIEDTAHLPYAAGIYWDPEYGGLARFHIGQPLADLQPTSLRVSVDRESMFATFSFADLEVAAYWPGVIEIPVDLDDLPEQGQARRVPVDE